MGMIKMSTSIAKILYGFPKQKIEKSRELLGKQFGEF